MFPVAAHDNGRDPENSGRRQWVEFFDQCRFTGSNLDAIDFRGNFSNAISIDIGTVLGPLKGRQIATDIWNMNWRTCAFNRIQGERFVARNADDISAVRSDFASKNTFGINGARWAAVQIKDITATSVAGLVPAQYYVLAIGQKARRRTLNFFQNSDIQLTLLTGLQRQQNNLQWRALNNGNGPLSVGRESSRPSFAQPHGQVAIHISHDDRIIRAGNLAGIFEQNKLPVGRNVFRNIPVMPRQIDFPGACRGGCVHAQPDRIQGHKDASIGNNILQREGPGNIEQHSQPSLKVHCPETAIIALFSGGKPYFYAVGTPGQPILGIPLSRKSTHIPHEIDDIDGPAIIPRVWMVHKRDLVAAGRNADMRDSSGRLIENMANWIFQPVLCSDHMYGRQLSFCIPIGGAYVLQDFSRR